VTEADQNKAYVQDAIQALTESNAFIEGAERDILDVGADLNAIRPHLDNALRKLLSALASLRTGNQTASFVLRGSSGMVAESIGMLERADTDLEDMVKAIMLIKKWIDDAQKGPYRTTVEERPRIVGKINSAIARLRSYWTTL
jgi:hypothetical protein